ncbi:PepSY domain-containing protein [Methylosinus sp. Sm6]|uniref:PepSY domain-containing protein n=1 Tax=Methylosinus sp. Sm6 TaxID=2866948 RepID=UPI001C99C4A2|nr:PepSY domain-containing protein [Methylosinus sp. Sm6]MBY6243090.1 PepSY domain-containing protein [Methylosinus sp. Sm6]
MKSLIFLHRWIGVVLALFMLVWFSTGLVIAFLAAPPITRAQQLAHAESLAPEASWLSLGDALAARALGGRHEQEDGVIVEGRLVRVAGAPAWLIENQFGRRSAISALDGAPIVFSPEQARRIADLWAEGADLVYSGAEEAPVGVRNAEALRPFHRFAAPDSREIVVSARTGEVVQSATRGERALIYAGNWLHLFRWLDLVGAGDYRRAALSWAGFFAAAAALTGVILGFVKWRPGFFGRPTYSRGRTQPYREFFFAYHFWAGLIGGVFALSWAASGFFSTNPGQIFSQPTPSPDEIARYRAVGGPDAMASATSAGVAALAPETVALSWSRIGDDAVLLAVSRDGERRALETGRTKAAFGEDALAAAAARLAGTAPISGRELLIDYDSYYYPNHHQSRIDKPLPVLRVDLADAGRSSLYIDPVDGRLLAKIDASRRVYRWLYSAVHHWDFGPFRDHWLWNGWMALWVFFGLALSTTAVVLAWRRLRRSIPQRERRALAAQKA